MGRRMDGCNRAGGGRDSRRLLPVHWSPYRRELGWRLHEGDDFHPQENIDKMSKGEPLTDQTELNKCHSEASFEQMVKAAGKELLTGAKAPTLS
ncbi:hypothetical protein D4764_05G0006060 [Takifugu flavidus]|uniref:Uncharacterized protein n=1 Tax=Takifugu flavidus TaxID=433684 RepID=A0A5C6MZR7_9TELE|nr:hypothetical protein D4764_05G0006060 [Takifugu flavidus]